jgi:hypothetical protein
MLFGISGTENTFRKMLFGISETENTFRKMLFGISENGFQNFRNRKCFSEFQKIVFGKCF